MKYKGIELQEFKSDKPVVFDPPRKMLVWDHLSSQDSKERIVYAYVPRRPMPAVICDDYTWAHCAEIPERPKPRRATNRELSKWLAQGNGEWKANNENFSRRRAYFDYTDDLAPVLNVLIRKWDDDDWREPTVDYMGLEAK